MPPAPCISPHRPSHRRSPHLRPASRRPAHPVRPLPPRRPARTPDPHPRPRPPPAPPTCPGNPDARREGRSAIREGTGAWGVAEVFLFVPPVSLPLCLCCIFLTPCLCLSVCGVCLCLCLCRLSRFLSLSLSLSLSLCLGRVCLFVSVCIMSVCPSPYFHLVISPSLSLTPSLCSVLLSCLCL
jgi:hypothetical protein